MVEVDFPDRAGKPARRWQLDGHLLTGPRGAVDLGHVTLVTLRVSRADGNTHQELILSHPEGAFSIPCAVRTDADGQSFDTLLTAIVATLPAATPAKLEQGRLPDWPKHLLGWFALVVAIALGWRAGVIGLTGDRMATVAAPMLILAAIGVTLILAYRPRPRIAMDIPVTQLPIALKAL